MSSCRTKLDKLGWGRKFNMSLAALPYKLKAWEKGPWNDGSKAAELPSELSSITAIGYEQSKRLKNAHLARSSPPSQHAILLKESPEAAKQQLSALIMLFIRTLIPFLFPKGLVRDGCCLSRHRKLCSVCSNT